MAHTVKCKICGQKFDLETVQGVECGNRRYAHMACFPQGAPVPMVEKRIEGTVIADKTEVVKKKSDRMLCLDYIQQLFGADNCDWGRITAQLSRYVNEYGYTYSGIHNALIYYYEIEKHEIQQWATSLGIIPYIYSKVKKELTQIQQSKAYNNLLDVEYYKPIEIEITYHPQQTRKIRRKKSQWLDEE